MRSSWLKLGIPALLAVLMVGSVFAGVVAAQPGNVTKMEYKIKKEPIKTDKSGITWKVIITGKNIKNQSFEAGAYVIERNGKFKVKNGNGKVYNSLDELAVEVLGLLPSLTMDLSTSDPNPIWPGTSNLVVHVTANAGALPLPRLEYGVFLPEGIKYLGVYTGPAPSVTSTTDGCTVGLGSKVGSGSGTCLTWGTFTRSYDKTTGISLKFLDPGYYKVPGTAEYFWLGGVWVSIQDDDYVIYRTS